MAAELVGFAVKTIGPVRVVGKELRTGFSSFEDNPSPPFGIAAFQDGTVGRA